MAKIETLEVGVEVVKLDEVKALRLWMERTSKILMLNSIGIFLITLILFLKR